MALVEMRDVGGGKTGPQLACFSSCNVHPRLVMTVTC